MLLGEPLAEKRDRADVLERTRPSMRAGTNPSPVYRNTISSSPPSGIGRKNPVSALVTASSFRVVELVAEDVRDAGVVRAAVQVAAVRREHEAVGHRRAEIELARPASTSPARAARRVEARGRPACR